MGYGERYEAPLEELYRGAKRGDPALGCRDGRGWCKDVQGCLQ